MKANHLPFISVCVAARDEAANILSCLEALNALHYPAQSLEIWLADDASHDDTPQLIHTFIADKPQFRLMGTQGEGKQMALAQLTAQTKGEYIFFTDADCIVPSDWINALLPYFADERVGIVAAWTLPQGTTWAAKCQTLEWAGVWAVLALAQRGNIPLTVMGNNLAVRREAYEQVGGYAALAPSLTEDLALFRRMIAAQWGYALITSPAALTYTLPSALKALPMQRLRWLHGALTHLPAWAKWAIWSKALWEWVMLLGYLLSGNIMFLWGIFLKVFADFAGQYLLLRRVGLLINLLYFGMYVIYSLILNIITMILYFTNTRVQWKRRKY